MQNKKKLIYTIGIYCLMFIASVCTTTQGVLLTDYIRHFQLESFRQGLVSAAQSGGNLVALFVVGLILSKLQKKYVLMITAVMIPAMFFLFGSVPAFPLFLFGYFLYGIAFGFLDSLGSSMMVDLYPDNSNVFMNLLHAIYGVGGLMGPVFLKILRTRDLEWNRMLVVTGIFATVAALIYIMATFLTRDFQTKKGGGQEMIHFRDMAEFMKDKKKLWLLIGAFLYGAHQIGITVWMTRYISDYLNAPQLGAFAVSMFWGAVFVSRLVLPRVKIDEIFSLILYNLIACVGIAVGVISGNPLVMMIGIGISGLAEGTVLPTELDVSCHWEIDRTSLGSSMVLIAHYLGFITAPILIGYLAAHCSIRIAVGTSTICSLLGALVSVVIYREVKKEK